MLEPVQGAPAALAKDNEQRALVVADYHAGIERTLREEGVELDAGGTERRARLLDLVAETDPDSLVILGDLVHAIGDPLAVERTELEQLFEALALPVTLIKGNHDGVVEPVLGDISDRLDQRIEVTPATGYRFGPIGFVHGHTWPRSEVLDATILCVGHEHPAVRLQDDVGGYRFERAWLRGSLDPSPFREHGLLPDVDQVGVTGNQVGVTGDQATVKGNQATAKGNQATAKGNQATAKGNQATAKGNQTDPVGPQSDSDTHHNETEIVVFPAFNERTGRSAVNTGRDSFLAPFLPDAFDDCEAYLLDGTRLGRYRAV